MSDDKVLDLPIKDKHIDWLKNYRDMKLMQIARQFGGDPSLDDISHWLFEELMMSSTAMHMLLERVGELEKNLEALAKSFAPSEPTQ